MLIKQSIIFFLVASFALHQAEAVLFKGLDKTLKKMDKELKKLFKLDADPVADDLPVAADDDDKPLFDLKLPKLGFKDLFAKDKSLEDLEAKKLEKLSQKLEKDLDKFLKFAEKEELKAEKVLKKLIVDDLPPADDPPPPLPLPPPALLPLPLPLVVGCCGKSEELLGDLPDPYAPYAPYDPYYYPAAAPLPLPALPPPLPPKLPMGELLPCDEDDDIGGELLT